MVIGCFHRSRPGGLHQLSESFDNGTAGPSRFDRTTQQQFQYQCDQAEKRQSRDRYTDVSAGGCEKRTAWPGLRCPVAVALSEDVGKTFPLIREGSSAKALSKNENKVPITASIYPYLCRRLTEHFILHLLIRHPWCKWMSSQKRM